MKPYYDLLMFFYVYETLHVPVRSLVSYILFIAWKKKGLGNILVTLF